MLPIAVTITLPNTTKKEWSMTPHGTSAVYSVGIVTAQ